MFSMQDASLMLEPDPLALILADDNETKATASTVNTRTLALLDIDALYTADKDAQRRFEEFSAAHKQTKVSDDRSQRFIHYPNSVLNEKLMSDLLKSGIKDVLILTDSKKLHNACFSLIGRFLCSQGFQFHGVLSSSDPIRNNGIGFSIQEIDSHRDILLFDPHGGTKEEIGAANKYELEFKNNQEKTALLRKEKGYLSSFGIMYEYFLKNCYSWVGSVIVLSSEQNNLDDVKTATNKASKSPKLVLSTVKLEIEEFKKTDKHALETHQLTVNDENQNAIISTHQTKQKLLNELEKSVLTWDLNPFFRKNTDKKLAFKKLIHKIQNSHNKNVKTVIDEWMQESYDGSSLTNHDVLHTHRNRFFSKNRPASKRTSSEIFIEELTDKYQSIKL